MKIVMKKEHAQKMEAVVIRLLERSGMDAETIRDFDGIGFIEFVENEGGVVEIEHITIRLIENEIEIEVSDEFVVDYIELIESVGSDLVDFSRLYKEKIFEKFGILKGLAEKVIWPMVKENLADVWKPLEELGQKCLAKIAKFSEKYTL